MPTQARGIGRFASNIFCFTPPWAARSVSLTIQHEGHYESEGEETSVFNSGKMHRPEKNFCSSNFDFSTFLSFHHLAGGLFIRPRFLGIFEYFPPARVPYSSGFR
jgi:hypothetical protein